MFEYAILHDTVSILHSKELNGKMLIKVFDDSTGLWRELNIQMPEVMVLGNSGFTPYEVYYYLNFAINNYSLMKKCASLGGVNNL